MTRIKRTMSSIVLGGLFAIGFIAIPAQEIQAQETQVTYEDIQQQGIIFAGICTSGTAECACRDRGDCELDDILQVFVNISTFILGISGSITLLMFVYGGIVWLTSAGNENRVAKGKQILGGTIIGLCIIFGAYTAITLIVSALRTGAVPPAGPSLEDVTQT